MKSILVVAPQPFFQERGTPIAIKALVCALEELNYKITLYTLLEGEDIPLPSNVTVKRASYPKFFLNLRPGFSLKKVIVDFYLVSEVLKELQLKSYDIVLAVEESAIFLSLLSQIGDKLIVDMDSDIVDQLANRSVVFRTLRPICEYLYKLPFKNSRAVIAVTKDLAARAVRLGANQAYVLEDFSPPYSNELDPQLLELKGDSKVIFYCGNFERYQGLELLFDSLVILKKNLPNFKLFLVGGHEKLISENRKVCQAKNLLDHVYFFGPQPQDKLGLFFNICDCVVSPRLFGTNTPMKIYSYMASGKPIVATKIRSHTQVLSMDCAFLSELTPEDLSRSILLALQSPERQAKAERAKKLWSEHFTQEEFKRKVKAIFKELAS